MENGVSLFAPENLRYKICFYSSFVQEHLDFLEKIQKFLDKYNIVSHINLDKKFGHTYKLEIRNKSSILIYLEKCYENDTMYLERKYNRYN